MGSWLLTIMGKLTEAPVPEAVLSYDAEHKGVRLIWKCSSVQNERRKIMLA